MRRGARRIEQLETDRRRTQAILDGQSAAYSYRVPDGKWKAQLEANLEHVEAQLAYWRGVRGDQVDAGRAREYSAADFEPGDRVRIRGQ